MKIVCPSCSAAYRFDLAKVPEDGKKVQCSRCEHVFTVHPSGDTTSDAQATQNVDPSGAAAQGGELRQFIVRQDGTRYKVKDLPTLKRWIVERRLTRTAEVSTDEISWEIIGEMEELRPHFDMVDQEAQRAFLTPRTGTSTKLSGKPRIGGVRVMTAQRPSLDETQDGGDTDFGDVKFELEEDGWDGPDDSLDEGELEEAELEELATEQGSSFPDIGEIEEDAGSWQGGRTPSVEEGTPVFNKAALMGTAKPGESLEVDSGEVVPAKTAAGVTSTQSSPEKEEESKVAWFPLLAVALLLFGLVWFLFLRTPSDGPGPVAHNPTSVKSNPPVLPKPTPTVKRTPTPAPATPTVTPTPTGVPATPTATATSRPAPKKPRKPRVTKPPRPQPTAKPSASPAVLADRAYREAKALQNKGDFAGAIDKFRLANRHRPRAVYYEELGFSYMELHDADRKASYLSQGEGAFKSALKLDKRADSWLGLGVTYRRQGRKTDAIEAFEACLRSKPSEDTAGEAEWFLKQLKAGSP